MKLFIYIIETVNPLSRDIRTNNLIIKENIK